MNITSVFGAQGINYFGTNYTSIYINTNGLITFQAPVTGYTPTNLSTLTYPAIAPYWSDVNITSGSATGTNNIYWDLDPVTHKVTITWLGVRAYQNPNTQGTNTFQVSLEHTHDGNFEIDFTYRQIQWTNGYAGVAQAGLTDGGANDYIIPGSGNSAALLQYPNSSLDTGQPNGTYSTRFLDGNPVCFVAGTLIATPTGPRAVETLRSGDLVSTYEAGAQPLIWAGGSTMIAAGRALPMGIGAGVLDNDRDLWVSPRHLLRLSGADCMLLFGVEEVLVPARDLAAFPGVTTESRMRKVSYHHLMLDCHHLIWAEGALAESLRPGPVAMASLPPRSRADLVQSVPPDRLALIAATPAARRVLRRHEAALLLAGRAQSATRRMPKARMDRV